MEKQSINPNALGLCVVNGIAPWEYFDLNENSLVVDLGACRGDFAKYICETYNCRVDAYEPTYMDLDHYELHHPKLRVIQKPVYDGSPVAFDIYSGTNGSIFDGFSKKIQSVDIREITKEHINLMKINVEGAEMKILELADLNNVDQIIVEFHLFRGEIPDAGITQEGIDRLIDRIMSFGYRMILLEETSPSYMFYGKFV